MVYSGPTSGALGVSGFCLHAFPHAVSTLYTRMLTQVCSLIAGQTMILLALWVLLYGACVSHPWLDAHCWPEVLPA